MKFDLKMLLILFVFGLNNTLLQASEKKEQSESDLFKAVEHGSFEHVKNLIFNGSDLNVIDEEGKTPLIKAVQFAQNYKYYIDCTWTDCEEMEERIDKCTKALLENEQIINLLLIKGADLNVIDDTGKMAFDYAEGNIGILKILKNFEKLRKDAIKETLKKLLIPDLTDIVRDY